MELVSFALAYFAAKRLSLLTAFLCWRPEELSALCRDAQRQGMRISVADWTRLPPLEPYGTHREGMLLDVTCPGAPLVLEKASLTRAFNLRHTWLLLHNAPFNASLMEATLGSTVVLPDADVAWAANDQLLDVYRIKHDQALITMQLGFDAARVALPAASTRRRHLNNVNLRSSTIISQPQFFKGWDDLTVRQIDTFPKLTWPLMHLLADDLHFRYNLIQVDSYGENRNGSFTGLAGQLQRQEIEVGITSMFLRADRMQVLHFCSETVELRGAFMFRQPSKSSVSNVFLLPFSRGVWIATALTLVLAAATLALLARRPHLRAVDASLEQLSIGEAVIFTVGTACQQGFHIVPALASARVVMFCALMTALFAFTSYSAKIVAILQTPSDAIRTIDDLTNSPMTMGVQETTYKRVYFAESTQPATQRLYRHKLLPLGDRAYLSVVDGVAAMRTGLFAFQVEEPSGYDIISKTFTEREKCGLKQIQAFKLPMVAVPIRKHSGYKELFATRLRWQRETGLMDRTRRIWLASKPRCDASSGGFVSVGIIDILPALHVLAAGMAASVLFLVLERSMARLKCGGRPRHLTSYVE
ncbi:glutamate receptor ionotropic, kainate glr-3-like isoform X1 [Cydia strobilella]|uniref:glutamate receptor ionotropic, kainate glr-3-like isoform X1 n=2 Tax=Cydia strobilella TaxID=1100964 RepID=UPI0030045FBF